MIVKNNNYIISTLFFLNSLVSLSQNSPKNDSLKIDYLYGKVSVVRDTNPDLAIHYSLLGLTLSQKNNDSKRIIKGYNSLGWSYYRKKDTHRALEYFNYAKNTAQKNNLNKYLTHTLTFIGTIYSDWGMYDKSTDCYIQSLNISKNEKDTSNILMSYIALAENFYNQAEYSKANEYNTKAMELGLILKDSIYYANALSGVGAMLYIGEKKYRETISILKIAERIYQSTKNYSSLPAVYINTGLCYDYLGKIDSAYYMYKKADDMGKKYHLSETSTIALSNMGEICFEKKDYKTAQSIFLEALQLAQNANNKKNISILSQNLVKLYIALGDYQKAYYYKDLYSSIQDSIMSSEKTRALQELNVRFQTKEMEEQNTVLQQENDIKTLRIERKNNLMYSLIVIVLLAVIILLLFLKQNKLKVQKEKIELEQKLLRSQMNPHFIFNSLHSIQNFILTNQQEESFSYLTSFSRLMRLFLENSKHELITLDKEINTINYYLKLQQLRFKNKFTYVLNIDSSIDKEFIFIPPMLLQPFLENTLEHGFKNVEEKGEIIVNISSKSNELTIELIDNGIGIEKSLSNKKIEATFSHHSRALEITKQRIELINQKHKTDITIQMIDLSSIFTDKHGTKIIIHFPKILNPS